MTKILTPRNVLALMTPPAIGVTWLVLLPIVAIITMPVGLLLILLDEAIRPYFFPFLCVGQIDWSPTRAIQIPSASYPLLFTSLQWLGMGIANVWLVHKGNLKRPYATSVAIIVVTGLIAGAIIEYFNLPVLPSGYKM